MMFECVITTPFGSPVEPDVNRMWAGSCSLFRLSRGSREKLSMSFQENSGLTLLLGGKEFSIQPTETASWRLWQENNCSSSPATAPTPRIKRGPLESRILAIRAAGLDVSTGTWMQPAFRIPRMATIAAGDFGMAKQTRSPFLQPAAFRIIA